MGGHGCYGKHHPLGHLIIRRVKCQECGSTHALIPRFSLPQTSHDTDSVETYLVARSDGQSRRTAGGHILAQGFEKRVLKRLERRFERGCRNWSALFAIDPPLAPNLTALAQHIGQPSTGGVLFAANRFALGRRVNAVFNSRSSILLFRNHRTGGRFPHNLASPQEARLPPDSS
jgi:hypothetical protein